MNNSYINHTSLTKLRGSLLKTWLKWLNMFCEISNFPYTSFSYSRMYDGIILIDIVRMGFMMQMATLLEHQNILYPSISKCQHYFWIVLFYSHYSQPPTNIYMCDISLNIGPYIKETLQHCQSGFTPLHDALYIINTSNIVTQD